MASPPLRRPSLPTTPNSFRRSFTAPVKLPPSPQPEHVDPSDAAAEILYSHPTTKTFSFSLANAGLSKPASRDFDYPVDAIETLPWTVSRESMVAQGSLVIEKVRGSAVFLKTAFISHAMMRNSQCWCVDGSSKFVLRVREFKYYRIEFPNATEEDRQKIEQLKSVLRTIIRFEVTPCPFKRDFKVALPESTITPKKKRAWQPRRSLSKSSPLGLTSVAHDDDDRPESRASILSDAMTEGDGADGSDTSRSSACSEDESAVGGTSGETKAEDVHGKMAEEQGFSTSLASTEGVVDLDIQEEDSPSPAPSDPALLQQQSSPELTASSVKSSIETDQTAQGLEDVEAEPLLQTVAETRQEVSPHRVEEDGVFKDEIPEEQNLDDEEVKVETSAVEPTSTAQIVQNSVNSPTRVDPADFGLDSPVKAEHFDDGLPVLMKSADRVLERSDDTTLKDDVSISGESFHSMVTHRSSSSSMSLSPPYWDAILPLNSHKRGPSEVTVKADTSVAHGKGDSETPEQPSTPILIRDSPSDAEWPEIETPAPSESVRQFLRERRIRAFPEPSSSVIETSHHSSDRNLTKALVQKAASFAVGKPLEAVILLLHVLGRIAAGATVNDLLSGDLFRQPDKDGRGRSTVTTAGTAHDDHDFEEDDYSFPIRARSRHTFKEGPDSEVD